MSQQEMSFEGNRENRQEYHQHDFERSGQKIYPQMLNKATALRIRSWLPYISLALAMLMSFILGGQSWNIGEGNIAPHWVILLIVYLFIIVLHVSTNIFIAHRYKR